MGSLNLAAITATSPYIKKIQSALEKQQAKRLLHQNFAKLSALLVLAFYQLHFSFQVALRLHFIFVH